jgi:hypothetical protein
VYPAKRPANEIMDMAGIPIATLGGIPNNLNVGGGDVVVETIEVPDNAVGLGTYFFDILECVYIFPYLTKANLLL